MKQASSRQIEAWLMSLGDAVIAEHSQRYFKTGEGEYGAGDRFLGIRVPMVRKVVRDFRDVSLDEIEKLVGSSYHEIRLFALLSLVQRFGKSDEAVRYRIYTTYLKNAHHINNWDLVDSSAPYIVGGWLYERDRKILYKLVRSASLWERRVAILATFYFIREGDFRDTLALAEMLLQDQEDLIHKAVGWGLREVGKRDLDAEQAFLKKHYKAMPRTMLRYAIEKFDEKLRQRYLMGTI